MEKRFFYNPDNEKLYIFNSSHVQFFHNNRDKLNKNFDYYIRGILKDDILYLRCFYPYDDIIYLSHKDIMKKSMELLNIFKNAVLTSLYKEGIKVKDIKLNVSNEDLKTFLNTLYV